MRVIAGKDGKSPPWTSPFEDPRWTRADLAKHMRPGDPVVGLESDGDAWALPWWIMKNHHVANLVLEGKPVLVNLCEVCSSAAAFDPVVDGRRHTFRLKGLYNSTIMPMDHETGSLWTGFTGVAIEGPMHGRVMRRLPLLQCTWSEWIALHPGTLVPDGEGEPRDGHGEGQSPGSPLVGPGMRKLLAHVDTRLPHHVLVLGVRVDGRARCYPLRTLDRLGPVLNDSLGGEPIAVFSRPGSWSAIAYSRELDGQCMTFRAEGGAIVDEQTGSRWEMSGRASSGPARGRRLRFVHSGIEEFFIWAAFHPATEILDPANAVEPSRLAPGLWTAELVPRAIRLASATWWTRGMKLLEAGCGEGLIAATLAERGLDVCAVDAEPVLIARACRSFRGMVRLEFGVADLRRPHDFGRQFEALVDHGLFAGLAGEEQATYISNIAAAALPGAKYLLLVPHMEANLEHSQKNILELFRPAFDVTGVKALPMPHPVTGVEVPAGVFGFVRRG